MNLILFGFKGVGKSYYGKRISAILNKPFLDTDVQLSEKFPIPGLTCKEIYKQVGELEFRKMEKEVIFSLRADLNGIIALGGGSVLDPENVAYLKTIGRLVYLKSNLNTFENYAWRLPIYESIPSYFVNVEDGVDIMAKRFKEFFCGE